MKITARFFASYRELVGQRQIEIEITKGATVAELAQEVKRRFPLFPSSPQAIAVNAEYVQPDHVLGDSDEVSFMPPVSGGDLFQITDKPISPEEVIDRVQGDEYGAVVTFIGKVRSYSQGKQVLYLEYDAYTEMAEKRMRAIAAEISKKWNLNEVAFCHRTGRVAVGEISLIIAIAAPHRREAFAACQYAVDRLKEIVPIWKKEVWVGWDSGKPEDKKAEEVDEP